MEQNVTLQTGFKGQAYINGQPMYNRNGVWTIGGYIDSTNTQPAYFGRVVSIVTGTDPYSFVMGFPADSAFAGVLMNEQNMQENAPAKPNYLLPTEPATAIYFGHFWLESWTTTATGAIAPVKGAKVIASNTTGQIEFLASATAVPVGWTQLNATVILVNANITGALIFVGQSNVTMTVSPSSDATMQAFLLPLSPYLCTINGLAITITVPTGSTVTALAPQFIVPEGAVVKVATVAQVSGLTTQDFTTPKTYDVTAPDGVTVKSYTVTVTVAP